MGDDLERARDAFARRVWTDAYALLRERAELGADDLDRLAVACYMTGREQESARAFEQAHRAHIRAGKRDRAVLSSFWLAVTLLLRGEMAPAGGWLARTERLVEELGESPVRAMLLVPQVLGAVDAGDGATAEALAAEMMGCAERFDDQDLRGLALVSGGQARLVLGDIRTAMKLFDEVMVAVTTGEISPILAGIAYCAVIDACMQACDLRRASEWTGVLQRWCDAQPGLVPYRGQCLVHRSQLLQAGGAWAEAMAEAEEAQRVLSDPPHAALGMALYQKGELHRLRGEFTAAERAYREASGYGRDPVPGLALLRLAEGNRDVAAASVRRMVDESHGKADRPTVLAAAAEVLVAVGDVEAARAAAEELGGLAAKSDAVLLHAMADYASGSVLLAAGDARSALARLRRACAGWRDIGMAYDSARARVQLAQACEALGDHDNATLELDAARATFERLGAAPDLATVERLAAPALAARPAGPSDGPLTDRECEVLRLVATGRTNREIAGYLVISEHTVARHLQNIFLKLGLTSRAGATAYAYEHGLV